MCGVAGVEDDVFGSRVHWSGSWRSRLEFELGPVGFRSTVPGGNRKPGRVFKHHGRGGRN